MDPPQYKHDAIANPSRHEHDLVGPAGADHIRNRYSLSLNTITNERNKYINYYAKTKDKFVRPSSYTHLATLKFLSELVFLVHVLYLTIWNLLEIQKKKQPS